MTRTPLLLGAALIAGTLSLSSLSPASATSALPASSPGIWLDNNIQPAATTVVKKKKVVKKKGKKKVVTTTTTKKTTKNKKWVYDSGKHGHRHRHKHAEYVYYHDGYYYSQPWWTIAVPGVGICIGC